MIKVEKRGVNKDNQMIIWVILFYRKVKNFLIFGCWISPINLVGDVQKGVSFRWWYLLHRQITSDHTSPELPLVSYMRGFLLSLHTLQMLFFHQM